MQTIRYELIPAQDAGGQVALITFDEQGSPVNTMCEQWQADLSEVTARVQADRQQLGGALKGIVLASAKTSFFAGADLRATMRLTPEDAPTVFERIEAMKKNFRTLETPGATLIEVERPDGARLRVQYRDAPPLAAVLGAFLEPARCCN